MNPTGWAWGWTIPMRGWNFSGEWFEGKTDEEDNPIPFAHSNARYTLRLGYLENIDPAYNDRNGVLVRGIIYGGRDSDTSVPIEESADWKSGIILKACTLESETTSATIGQEGVLAPQPMANLDFISYPIGAYIRNNIRFVEGMKQVPRIYAVNYFLRDEKGDFLTHKLAKKVWLHWAEQRIHDEVDAYRTPLGFIPKYEDLKSLFQEIFRRTFHRNSTRNSSSSGSMRGQPKSRAPSASTNALRPTARKSTTRYGDRPYRNCRISRANSGLYCARRI